MESGCVGAFCFGESHWVGENGVCFRANPERQRWVRPLAVTYDDGERHSLLPVLRADQIADVSMAREGLEHNTPRTFHRRCQPARVKVVVHPPPGFNRSLYRDQTGKSQGLIFRANGVGEALALQDSIRMKKKADQARSPIRLFQRIDYRSIDCIDGKTLMQASLHISRRIRLSGEMWLNRLDDRPQGNSQTIAQGRSFKL
jgi:hypothetical protein